MVGREGRARAGARYGAREGIHRLLGTALGKGGGGGGGGQVRRGRESAERRWRGQLNALARCSYLLLSRGRCRGHGRWAVKDVRWAVTCPRASSATCPARARAAHGCRACCHSARRNRRLDPFLFGHAANQCPRQRAVRPRQRARYGAIVRRGGGGRGDGRRRNGRRNGWSTPGGRRQSSHLPQSHLRELHNARWHIGHSRRDERDAELGRVPRQAQPCDRLLHSRLLAHRLSHVRRGYACLDRRRLGEPRVESFFGRVRLDAAQLDSKGTHTREQVVAEHRLGIGPALLKQGLNLPAPRGALGFHVRRHDG
jgi:hypothetical protein